jgi:arginase
MKVFFPQWQGAGESDAILHGAMRVRLALPFDWADVPGFQAGPAACEHGILNHASLLTNLRAYRALLADAQPDRVFSLGGDCASELAPIAYLLSVYGRDLAVVWFDAHADANTPQSSPSGTLHGMPVRLLLGEGDPALLEALGAQLAPEQLVYAGIRDLDAAEASYLAELSVERWRVQEIEAGVPLVTGALERLRGCKVFVHVDVDVIDPREFRGVACPTAGGVSFEALLSLLEALVERCDVVGAGLVEFVGEAPDDVARAARLFRALSRGSAPVPSVEQGRIHQAPSVPSVVDLRGNDVDRATQYGETGREVSSLGTRR